MVTKKQLLGAKFKDGKIFEVSNKFMTGFQIYPAYNRAIATSDQLQKGKSMTHSPDKSNLSSVELSVKYPNPLRLNNKTY